MKKISLVLAVLAGGTLIAFSGTASAKNGYKNVPSSALHHLNKNVEIARKRLRRKKKFGPSIDRDALNKALQTRKPLPWPDPGPLSKARQVKGNMKTKFGGMKLK